MSFRLGILGLSTAEMRLIRDCSWALTQSETGNYLPSPRWRKACLRLIERGFLTDAKAGFVPPSDWIAVRLTQANLDALADAAGPGMAARPEYPLLLEEIVSA